MPSNDSARLPTFIDVERVAAERGFEVDEYFPCRTQGVLIAYSRAKRDGETFLGLPVAGERVRSEVIERNFCPDVVAPDDVFDTTIGRACQRAIWHMEAPDAL